MGWKEKYKWIIKSRVNISLFLFFVYIILLLDIAYIYHQFISNINIFLEFINMINIINIDNILTVITIYILGPIAVIVLESNWDEAKQIYSEYVRKTYMYISLVIPLMLSIFLYIYIKDVNITIYNLIYSSIFSNLYIKNFFETENIIFLLICICFFGLISILYSSFFLGKFEVEDEIIYFEKTEILSKIKLLLISIIVIFMSTLINSSSVKLFIIIYINSFIYGRFFLKEILLAYFKRNENSNKKITLMEKEKKKAEILDKFSHKY